MQRHIGDQVRTARDRCRSIRQRSGGTPAYDKRVETRDPNTGDGEEIPTPSGDRQRDPTPRWDR